MDEGLIPCCKTPGGHRKLLLEDVQRFIKDANFPNANIRQLVGDQHGIPPCPHQAACELAGHLVRGREVEASEVILNFHRSTGALDFLADEVVSPAMRIVGHQWQSGKIDILEEHRATQICKSALYELKANLESLHQGPRPIALGGSPEGDLYSLASLLIELALLELGWEVVNLGPNTPMASFERGLDKLSPKLIWLSITHVVDLDCFEKEIEHLFEKSQKKGVSIIAGGLGLTPEVRAILPALHLGESLKDLVTLAKSIHGPTMPPARGRPKKLRADRDE